MLRIEHSRSVHVGYGASLYTLVAYRPEGLAVAV